MKPTDREAFAKTVMLPLHAAFGWDDADRVQMKAEVYFEALMPYEAAEIEAAVKRLIRVEEFWPRPARIIAEIGRGRRALAAQRQAEPRALAEPILPIEETKSRLRALIDRVVAAVTPEPPKRHLRSVPVLMDEVHRLRRLDQADPGLAARKVEALRRAGL